MLTLFLTSNENGFVITYYLTKNAFKMAGTCPNRTKVVSPTLEKLDGRSSSMMSKDSDRIGRLAQMNQWVRLRTLKKYRLVCQRNF